MVPFKVLRPHSLHAPARCIFVAAAGVAVDDRGKRVTFTDGPPVDPRGDMDARDRMNPERRRVVNERPGWVTPAIIGALLLAGLLAYAASGNRDRTATTPAPETTGRTERAPVPPAAPLPANPNATTPQAAPDVPRQ
jgi:hypothetical protein